VSIFETDVKEKCRLVWVLSE